MFRLFTYGAVSLISIETGNAAAVVDCKELRGGRPGCGQYIELRVRPSGREGALERG
jgi:hypothetical protein